jgi:hypothetical protein
MPSPRHGPTPKEPLHAAAQPALHNIGRSCLPSSLFELRRDRPDRAAPAPVREFGLRPCRPAFGPTHGTGESSEERKITSHSEVCKAVSIISLTNLCLERGRAQKTWLLRAIKLGIFVTAKEAKIAKFLYPDPSFN